MLFISNKELHLVASDYNVDARFAVLLLSYLLKSDAGSSTVPSLKQDAQNVFVGVDVDAASIYSSLGSSQSLVVVNNTQHAEHVRKWRDLRPGFHRNENASIVLDTDHSLSYLVWRALQPNQVVPPLICFLDAAYRQGGLDNRESLLAALGVLLLHKQARDQMPVLLSPAVLTKLESTYLVVETLRMLRVKHLESIETGSGCVLTAPYVKNLEWVDYTLLKDAPACGLVLTVDDPGYHTYQCFFTDGELGRDLLDYYQERLSTNVFVSGIPKNFYVRIADTYLLPSPLDLIKAKTNDVVEV